MPVSAHRHANLSTLFRVRTRLLPSFFGGFGAERAFLGSSASLLDPEDKGQFYIRDGFNRLPLHSPVQAHPQSEVPLRNFPESLPIGSLPSAAGSKTPLVMLHVVADPY